MREYTLASRKRRIVAFMVDHIFLSFLCVGLVFLLLGADFVDSVNPFRILFALLTGLFIGLFLYISKDSIRGMSLGKWVMGIMVREDQNEQHIPSFGKLMLRNVPVLMWPVEAVMLITNDDKKRFGDKMAQAVVVNNPRKSNKWTRGGAMICIALAASFMVVLFFLSAIKQSSAYQTSIAYIEQDDQLLEQTGGIAGYGYFPRANIQTHNGSGEASVQVTVKGVKQDVDVYVYLVKSTYGSWQVKDVSY